ncbi:hypothetical protein ANAPRD1_01371 [Anaplasma phagocytophilum]|nr:hypothetical protein ANAPRD1_01371 [Anaplasma phagocytophilum]
MNLVCSCPQRLQPMDFTTTTLAQRGFVYLSGSFSLKADRRKMSFLATPVANLVSCCARGARLWTSSRAAPLACTENSLVQFTGKKRLLIVAFDSSRRSVDLFDEVHTSGRAECGHRRADVWTSPLNQLCLESALCSPILLWAPPSWCLYRAYATADRHDSKVRLPRHFIRC